MTDVRDLLVRIHAIDTATDAIEEIKDLISKWDKSIVLTFDTTAITTAQATWDTASKAMSTPIEAKINVDTSNASNALQNFSSGATKVVEESASKINNTLSSAFSVPQQNVNVSNALENTTVGVTSGVQQATSAMEQNATTSEKLKGVWASITDVASGVKGTVNGLVDSINTASVAIGAVVAIGANKAFKSANLQDALKESFKNDEYLKVMESVDKLPDYVNKDEYAKSLIKGKEKGISLKESTSMLSTIGQAQFSNAGTWATQGRSMEGALQMITSQAMYARSSIKAGKDISSRVNKQLSSWGFGELSKKDIDAAYKELRASGEVKGKKKDSDLDKIFRTAVMNKAKETIQPINWDDLSTSQRLQLMQSKLSNLQNVVTDAVIPALAKLVDWITALIDIIGKIPGGTTLIGYATVFTTIAVLASRLAGTFNVLTSSISGARLALAMYQRVAMSGVASDVMKAEGIMGPVQQFGGPKAGLNQPLRSIGNFAGKIGLATSVNAEGKVVDGLFTKIRNSSKAAGGGISGAFTAAKTAVTGSLKVMGNAIVAFGKAIMANPYVAIAAIIVLIIYLLYRWGYLQRAWEKFSNSEFGKDVIYAFKVIQSLIWYIWEKFTSFLGLVYKNKKAGILSAFEAVATFVGDLFNKFDKFYSALKSGDLGEIFGTGSDLLSSLSFIMPIFLYIKLIFDAIETLYDFLKDPIGYIQDFLESIKYYVSKLLSPLTGLFKYMEQVYEYLKSIKERIMGKTLEGNALKTAFTDAVKNTKADDQVSNKYAAFANMSDDELSDLYKVASGEMTKMDFGNKYKTSISDPDMDDLTELYKNLKTTGNAEGKTSDISNVVSTTYDSVSNGISDATKGIGDSIEGSLGVTNTRVEDSSGQEWYKTKYSDGSIRYFKNVSLGTDEEVTDVNQQKEIENLIGEKSKSEKVEGSYAGGTNYVPKTGIYELHKGEKVTPASQSGDTSSYDINVNFNNYGSGSIDQKTKTEFTKLVTSTIDSYMSKKLRHRQSS